MSWNFTVEDTSPVLSYAPYADGFGLQNGWQTWYTTSGFNTQPGESPQGDSFHLTSRPDAQVTFHFYGNSIFLYGTSNASYEVSLDNIVQSFSPTTDTLLYSKDGLVEETHAVTLSAKPSNTSQQLGFSHAIVSTSSAPLQNPTELDYDSSNSALVYSGQWSTTSVSGIPNSTVTVPFHQTLEAGSSVTMNFSNAVAVALYASTNFGHSLYSVSIDDGFAQTYNASTFWLVANTVIFFQSGLDSGRTHTLNATNISGAGAKFTLSSVTVFQANASQTVSSSPSTTGSATGTLQSHHSNVGAIVGSVVGALVLVLIAAVACVGWRRKSSRDHAKTTISPLVLSPPRTPNQETSEMAQTGQRKGLVSWAQPTTVSSPNRAPSTSHSGAPSPTSSPTTPDVNQIIELIAQRIDRRGDGYHDGENPLPPDYRVH